MIRGYRTGISGAHSSRFCPPDFDAMTSASHDDVSPHERDRPDEPVRYPTNHVLAVFDTQPQLSRGVDALTAGGFLPAEVSIACGPEAADAVGASSGRGGLAGLANSIADWIGIENKEMEIKGRYEQAMRDGRYVVRVAAPTDERKDRAAEILAAHGAHTVTFHGRFTIEAIVPPAGA